MSEKVERGAAQLAFILLASLSCGADAFALEPAGKSSGEAVAAAATKPAALAPKAEAPRNAVLDQLTGTWDVAYDDFGQTRSISALLKRKST